MEQIEKINSLKEKIDKVLNNHQPPSIDFKQLLTQENLNKIFQNNEELKKENMIKETINVKQEILTNGFISDINQINDHPQPLPNINQGNRMNYDVYENNIPQIENGNKTVNNKQNQSGIYKVINQLDIIMEDINEDNNSFIKSKEDFIKIMQDSSLNNNQLYLYYQNQMFIIDSEEQQHQIMQRVRLMNKQQSMNNKQEQELEEVIQKMDEIDQMKWKNSDNQQKVESDFDLEVEMESVMEILDSMRDMSA